MHLFIFISDICLFSLLGSYQFRSFCPVLKLGSAFFYYWFLRAFHILDTNFLRFLFQKIFLSVVVCFIILTHKSKNNLKTFITYFDCAGSQLWLVGFQLCCSLQDSLKQLQHMGLLLVVAEILQLWHVDSWLQHGSSSLTRMEPGPCIVSVESQPLTHQEVPRIKNFFFNWFALFKLLFGIISKKS